METQPHLPLLRKKRGTISRIACAVGVSRQAVSQWDRVPAEHVLTVARVTGKSPHELRPDIYPENMAPPGEAQP